jgi:hypothetical protein
VNLVSRSRMRNRKRWPVASDTGPAWPASVVSLDGGPTPRHRRPGSDADRRWRPPLERSSRATFPVRPLPAASTARWPARGRFPPVRPVTSERRTTPWGPVGGRHRSSGSVLELKPGNARWNGRSTASTRQPQTGPTPRTARQQRTARTSHTSRLASVSTVRLTGALMA